MDVARFCRQTNVVIVVGKGGVGKTTVAAALALAGARAGLDVLVAALDDSGPLPALFGRGDPFGYEEVVLLDATAGGAGGRVRGRVLTSDAALLEYLASHGLGRVARRLVQTGALDVVATAIPGIREVLVLGKLKQLERAAHADLLLLDAPATGHAMTFLTSSSGLVDAARGGPLRAQAEQVVELLADRSRCQVLLVTVPEETPVNEAIEAAYRLEDEVGTALGPVVVNGCYPVRERLDVDPRHAAAAAGVPPPPDGDLERLRAAADFRRARQELQRAQLERLGRHLPLPQIVLPYLFSAGVGPAELPALAEALERGIERLP